MPQPPTEGDSSCLCRSVAHLGIHLVASSEALYKLTSQTVSIFPIGIPDMICVRKPKVTKGEERKTYEIV